MNEKTIKYLILLSMFYITAYIGTFVLAYRMCWIFGTLQSAAIFIFPLTFFAGDIVAEVYGYKIAKYLIWFGLLCGGFFAISISLLIQLPPPPNWNHQNTFDFVLKPLLWFFISSATGVSVGSWLNVYVISKWRLLVKGKYFVMRSIGSSCIGELITSLIVEAMAFSSMLPFGTLIKLMIGIYLIKMGYAILLAYPAKLIAFKLKTLNEIKEPLSPNNVFDKDLSSVKC